MLHPHSIRVNPDDVAAGIDPADGRSPCNATWAGIAWNVDGNKVKTLGSGSSNQRELCAREQNDQQNAKGLHGFAPPFVYKCDQRKDSQPPDLLYGCSHYLLLLN